MPKSLVGPAASAEALLRKRQEKEGLSGTEHLAGNEPSGALPNERETPSEAEFGEPWNTEECNMKGHLWVMHSGGKFCVAMSVLAKMAERIVACVNYCQGLSNEELAKGRHGAECGVPQVGGEAAHEQSREIACDRCQACGWTASGFRCPSCNGRGYLEPTPAAPSLDEVRGKVERRATEALKRLVNCTPDEHAACLAVVNEYEAVLSLLPPSNVEGGRG